MKAIQEAITGNEDHGDLSSPYQALVQFYCAFILSAAASLFPLRVLR